MIDHLSVHVAFRATKGDQVDAFYEAALLYDSVCDGKPGTRKYPHADVYAACVGYPFGHKLEVICSGFAG
ncbi:hypothetical protein [Kordiimonas sp. SCSIO 12610]|uniref:hypothetical protein n=1 Tax=Kordiimonas sp. SCSIO 12610 TaxID=2829597 RepID=UPI002108C88A|nr:hypothetical protein [Kordiimonas sp. SCSIO 12610]UTW56099.1 hypothetical protein KFF44_04175 [Kordiimonas sp. SCSIO 12610]